MNVKFIPNLFEILLLHILKSMKPLKSRAVSFQIFAVLKMKLCFTYGNNCKYNLSLYVWHIRSRFLLNPVIVLKVV